MCCLFFTRTLSLPTVPCSYTSTFTLAAILASEDIYELCTSSEQLIESVDNNDVEMCG